jgi:hypothetical protein
VPPWARPTSSSGSVRPREDILVDAGRYTYVPKPDRYVSRMMPAHNLVTVDGKNSYVCQDSWSYSK